MISVVFILSFVVVAAIATLAYYLRRIAQADKAIRRLEADISDMNAKTTQEVAFDCSCKKISLSDSTLSMAAAAGKISKGKEFINNNNKTI